MDVPAEVGEISWEFITFQDARDFFFSLKLLGIFQGSITPFGVVFNYLPSQGED